MTPTCAVWVQFKLEDGATTGFYSVFTEETMEKDPPQMNLTNNYMTTESISQSYFGITFSYKLTKCNITVLKCLLE